MTLQMAFDHIDENNSSEKEDDQDNIDEFSNQDDMENKGDD